MHINLGRQLPSSGRGSGRAGTSGWGLGEGEGQQCSDLTFRWAWRKLVPAVTWWEINPLHKSAGKQRPFKVSKTSSAMEKKKEKRAVWLEMPNKWKIKQSLVCHLFGKKSLLSNSVVFSCSRPVKWSPFHCSTPDKLNSPGQETILLRGGTGK